MAETESVSKAKQLSSMTMEFCADSVEWCPFYPFSQFLVCGTYQLNKESVDDEQSRLGNISLFKFSTSTGSPSDSFGLVTTNVVPTSGILDMKWCPDMISDKPILAAACSDGKLLLYSINEEKDEINLFPEDSINLSIELNKILLSLDWSCENQKLHKIITSDNLGNLNYFSMREANLCMLKSWKAHEFESWIAAFDYDQSDIVYSGGDDCCLKCWDLRNSQLPVFVKKRYSMGVTAISKSKRNGNVLATGSYDENVLLWDTRQLRSPVSELCLGGGIWRLKWHPDNPEYLLSASMHNGFHVLSTKDTQLNLKLHYEKHESLAYGVDWCHVSECHKTKDNELCSSLKNQSLRNIISSCSFYDKLLTVWGIDF
ncbi:diphthine methyltransferase-like [Uloborus diversus]|uniref:diphthine methyltransferase-like n=1 Tax=Uloborus diversus TaxID=327109 RepID=UPI00240A6D93|nr:diphthine methyltransferase-like [Uloborus diversus]